MHLLYRGGRRRPFALALALTLAAPAGVASAAGPTLASRGIADTVRAAARTGSIAGLLGAVGDAVPASVAPAASFGDALEGLVARATLADSRLRDAITPKGRADIVRSLSSRDPAPSPHVDMATIRSEAAALAASIDSLLAAAPPARSAAADAGSAPCDVQEVPRVLCVSSEGPTLYPEGFNYFVSVDLGGNDVYENATATGACLDHEDPTNLYCVSVSIDLNGNDVYAPGAQLHGCEVGGIGPVWPTCGQGVGLGGIGMLVDLAGSDTYRTTGELQSDDCNGNFKICGVIMAQGSGSFGVGVLADFEGDDDYLVEVPIENVPDRSATIRGQGLGIIGDGVLWDRAGDDTYTIRGPATGWANPSNNYNLTGYSSFSGQGLGNIGDGAVVDEAGNDSFIVDIVVPPGARNRTTRGPLGEGAYATFDGQGFGIGLSGTPDRGLLITGKGATSYSVSIASAARGGIRAQAWGPGGVIDDQGGNDKYVAHVEQHTQASVLCDCPARLDIADFGPFVGFGLGVSTEAQGYHFGSLRDRGGDDVYQNKATARMEVRAESTGRSANATSRGYGSAGAYGQGSGAGGLNDDAGNDEYLLRAFTMATATATGATDSVARAIGGFAVVSGQGTGGSLNDRGGSDRYFARARTTSTASPDSFPDDPDGYANTAAQGLISDSTFIVQDGRGRLVDTDDGQDDEFHADGTLPFTTCSDSYGTSPGWVSGHLRSLADTETCVPAVSGAFVSSAEAPPAARFEHFTSSRDAQRITFSARLVDAEGAPIAGARVRFSDEAKFGTPYYGIGPARRWASIADREAVTDDDGWVHASMSVTACEPTTCEGFRGAALYFGDAQHGRTRITN